MIGEDAYQALLREARLTPKPGLVDQESSGAHRDMDLALLERSARALRPYLARFAERGAEEYGLPLNGRLSALRLDGMDVERAMFAATHGVNTHRGAIFLMGLLCYAAGRLSAQRKPLDALSVTHIAAGVCMGVTGELFASAGRAFLSYGAKGARGEAEAGFPSVIETAFPAYHDALHRGASEDDAWLLALLQLIANVTDANVLARCGREVAGQLRINAVRIALAFPAGGEDFRAALRRLDQWCVGQNASPGGCADLLSCAMFLSTLDANG